MLQIFPFAIWIAPIVSAVLLTMLWTLGELRPQGLAVLCCWFLLAGLCQFGAGSTLVAAAGLLLQTMLAIYLILRWRLASV